MQNCMKDKKNKPFPIRSLRLFMELLAVFFCVDFIFFIASAALGVLFYPNISVIVVVALMAAFFTYIIAMPGLILFALPLVVLMDLYEVRNRFFWILMGALAAIPSCVFAGIFILPNLHSEFFISLAIFLGGCTGFFLHTRLYKMEKEKIKW